MAKCDHCVVPASRECVHEFRPSPASDLNHYQLRTLARVEPVPPNAWCEDVLPALGDYRGCDLTGGTTLVRSEYTSGPYPDFIDLVDGTYTYP